MVEIRANCSSVEATNFRLQQRGSLTRIVFRVNHFQHFGHHRMLASENKLVFTHSLINIYIYNTVWYSSVQATHDLMAQPPHSNMPISLYYTSLAKPTTAKQPHTSIHIVHPVYSELHSIYVVWM